MNTQHKPLLEVRLVGPGVTEGKIYISDLVLLGQGLQTALNSVAWGLLNNAPGRRGARLPDDIREQCALQLVGLTSGSVVLRLDLVRDADSSIGVEALEKLITGLPPLEQSEGHLPIELDARVLSAWHDMGKMGKIFQRGIERAEFCLTIKGTTRRYDFLPQTLARLSDRVRARLQVKTIEGRLLMADFEGKRRCRVHPVSGPPIPCTFSEAIADKVKGALTSWVRVTGKAKVDLASGAIKTFAIREIELLDVTPRAPLPQPEDFWQRKTLEELASEQGVEPISRLEDILGKGAALWSTDTEFETFIADIQSRRKEDRE